MPKVSFPTTQRCVWKLARAVDMHPGAPSPSEGPGAPELSCRGGSECPYFRAGLEIMQPHAGSDTGSEFQQEEMRLNFSLTPVSDLVYTID